MAKALAKIDNTSPSQEELLFDTKRDLNPFWSSSLFSDVYLKNDLPKQYSHLWNNDEIGGFYNFYQGFMNLCTELSHESFENWKEADTIKNWIVPVLTLLGWEDNSSRLQNSYIDNTSFTLIENGKKQVYRPDLVFYDHPEHKAFTQKEKDADAKLREARDKNTGAKLVIEAKYWNRLSQRNEKSKSSSDTSDSASGLGPELQTLKYMDIFDHEFGVLTDGKVWFLFHKELSQGVECRSFKFDLGKLKELVSVIDRSSNEQKYREYAKYFYYFFSKESLVFSRDGKSKKTPLLLELLTYSKTYAHTIESDLRERFILTMSIACNSISKEAQNNNETISLETLRNVAESHIFNILFIRSCEVKGVLPIKSPNYVKISLHEVIESLTEMNYDPSKPIDGFLRDFRFGKTFGGKDFSMEGYDIFNRIINLYDVIHDGTDVKKDFGFEIEGFKESIFTKEEWRFAKKYKIPNKDMIEILFNLTFIKSEFPRDRKYQQIPYSYFSARQLGSIYESFLEYELKEASEEMMFIDGDWVSKKGAKQDKVLSFGKAGKISKKDLFFTKESDKRSDTGSFYTPDHVVKMMINDALKERIKELGPKELLNIKVIDPAMGSGHFLSGVLNFLTEVYRQKCSQLELECDESMQETAREILHSCIYGVDLNPRAVKLAKLSLWLSTAVPGKKLENLDDQLKSGDSLKTFNFKKEYTDVFKDGGFDLIVGNPPYVASKNTDFDSNLSGQADLYLMFVDKALNGELLKKGGAFSYIIPDPFFIRINGRELRKDLLERSNIEKVVHIGNVFEDANVTNCIITATLNSSRKDKITFERIEDGSSELSMADRKTFVALRKDLLSNPDFEFSYLNDERDIRNKNFLKKSFKKVSDYFIDSRGEEVGKKQLIAAEQKNGTPILIAGEGIGRYHLKKESIIKVNPNVLKKKPSLFENPKIILQKSSPKFIAALDMGQIGKDLRVTQAIYIIRTNDEMKKIDKNNVLLKFLIGVLNSDFSSSMLYKDVTGYKLLMPHYEQKDIKNFPFPPLSGKDIAEINSIYTSLSKLKNNDKLKGKTLNEKIAIIAKITTEMSEENSSDDQSVDLIEKLLKSIYDYEEAITLLKQTA